MTLPLSFRAQRGILGQWGRISPFGRNDNFLSFQAQREMTGKCGGTGKEAYWE